MPHYATHTILTGESTRCCLCRASKAMTSEPGETQAFTRRG